MRKKGHELVFVSCEATGLDEDLHQKLEAHASVCSLSESPPAANTQHQMLARERALFLSNSRSLALSLVLWRIFSSEVESTSPS